MSDQEPRMIRELAEQVELDRGQVDLPRVN